MKNSREVRSFVVDFLSRELIGPDPAHAPAVQLNGEEVLRPQDPPRHRYSAGILFPQKAVRERQVEVDEKDISIEPDDIQDDAEMPEEVAGVKDGEVADEAVPDTEQEVNLANDFLPSAMGISALSIVPESFRVKISAAQYEKTEVPGWAGWKKSRNEAEKKAWFRIPLDGEIFFSGSDLMGRDIVKVEKPFQIDGQETGLTFHVLSRPVKENSNHRLLTFTLINRKQSDDSIRNEDCFYQCIFELQGSEGEDCFLPYPERPCSDLNSEEISLKLLYRHCHVYAVGHGCSPDWDEGLNPGRAVVVRAGFLPAYEVKPILPRTLEQVDLSLFRMSEDISSAVKSCHDMADIYEQWVNEKKAEIKENISDSSLRQVAEKHLDNCEHCLERIRSGIALLESESIVQQAFSLMNSAMLKQHMHYRIASSKIREWEWDQTSEKLISEPFDPPDYQSAEHGWRPFQLAFILMNISSMYDENDPEREVVDLIWFPTGGGKTEAYLGLAAFSIFLRRLKNSSDGGTAVLMRYTLRLLTTQQFQRAASLICACEEIRRNSCDLGDEPYRIGLWVGGTVSPNSRDEAVRAHNQLMQGQSENKFILLSCPWCGIRFGPVKAGSKTKTPGYEKKSRPATIRFVCPDRDCTFSSPDGLPVEVVDGNIYDNPPTLLIGTVDKFAMLPWKPEARSLFGIGRDFSPPELIIQDELHLISGPLGSMVGHYETIIDAFCRKTGSEGGTSAKIVASTATIARADEQVKDLYARKAFLFPPQGLKAGDSFFAEEKPDRDGRMYVGVLTSALPSHVTSQIRVMAALLQALKSAEMNGAGADDVDPYWTLVGYFNSLREIGHAATLIQADIREYLNATWDRMGLTGRFGDETLKEFRRFINRYVELTSRIPSFMIPRLLQELFEQYRAETRADAVDVCFATNMIQVGIDVPRLSLMTIIGQPKTSSEYIQASSRVGRSESRPGLVVTNYNAFKPRDRSHFEHFRMYHQAMYRHVEPTSLTPFSIRVRDRALHALVVTLVRFCGGSDLRKKPNNPIPDDLKKYIREVILDRVSRIDPDEVPKTADRLEQLFSEWTRLNPPKYGGFGIPDSEVPLMHPAGQHRHREWHAEPWATQTSMRNVDSNCEALPVSEYTLTD